MSEATAKNLKVHGVGPLKEAVTIHQLFIGVESAAVVDKRFIGDIVLALNDAPRLARMAAAGEGLVTWLKRAAGIARGRGLPVEADGYEEAIEAFERASKEVGRDE